MQQLEEKNTCISVEYSTFCQVVGSGVKPYLFLNSQSTPKPIAFYEQGDWGYQKGEFRGLGH